MQAMLVAFISTNMSGIPPTKATSIGRMFSPLFMINLPEEEQIVEDLDDMEGMQVTIQAISFFVCTVVVIIILYHTCKRCCYMCSIVKYCFPFFPILWLLRGTCRTDLFVKVTNLWKGNMVWAHFTVTGYFPTSIRIFRPILKEKVHRDYLFLFQKDVYRLGEHSGDRYLWYWNWDAQWSKSIDFYGQWSCDH